MNKNRQNTQNIQNEPQKGESQLDELIRQAIDTTKPQFDAEKFRQKYPDQLRAILMRAEQTGPVCQPDSDSWKNIFNGPTTRIAAAITLIIGLVVGVLMGRDTWRPQQIQSAVKLQAEQQDPEAIYNLDCMTEAPKGSLADAYLTSVSEPITETDGKER